MGDTPDAPLLLKTLGEVGLYSADDHSLPLLGPVKPLAVPATLALLPDHRAKRTHLASLIWGTEDPKRARASLRQALHHLTRFGRGAGVGSSPEEVWLEEGGIGVDLWDLQTAAAVGDHARVIALGKGAFLEPLRLQVSRELTWTIDQEDDKVRAALATAYPQVIHTMLEAGALRDAVACATRWAAGNPLSAEPQRTLIRTLKVAGKPELALQTYEGFRSLLESESGGQLDSSALAALATLEEEMAQSESHDRVVFVPQPVGVPVGPSGEARRSRVLIGLLCASLAVSLGTLLWSPDPWPRGEAISLPLMTSDSFTGRQQVEITRGGVEFRQNERWTRNELARPGEAGGVAYTVLTEDGYDLWAEFAGGRDRVLLRAERADEKALAWAGGGGLLVFGAGEADSVGNYRYSVGWLDVRDRAEQALLAFDVHAAVAADWTVDGARIALQVGRAGPLNGLVILDSEGRLIQRLDVGSFDQPAWSPSGERLAFVDAGDAGDGFRLRTVDRDGRDVDTEWSTPAEIRTPFWFSDNRIGFVADFGLGGDLWVMERGSGQPARITNTSNVTALEWRRFPRRTWMWADSIPMDRWAEPLQSEQQIGAMVNSVAIQAPATLFAGETKRVTATAQRIGGGESRIANLALRWEAPPQATVTRDGLLRADLPGRLEIGVSWLGTHRADAIVDILPPPRAIDTLEILLEETWTSPVASSLRWLPFGDPLPEFEFSDSDSVGHMHNNGDANLSSGVRSEQRFAMAEGLTLEVDGRIPPTTGIFQDFVIGFAPQLPPADSLDVWSMRGPSLHAATRGMWVTQGTTAPVDDVVLSLPDSSGDTHTYAIQIEPGGRVAVVVDGTITWRGQLAADAVPDSVHLQLGGASRGARVEHGRVRLYRGLRYPIPDAVDDA